MVAEPAFKAKALILIPAPSDMELLLTSTTVLSLEVMLATIEEYPSGPKVKLFLMRSEISRSSLWCTTLMICSATSTVFAWLMTFTPNPAAASRFSTEVANRSVNPSFSAIMFSPSTLIMVLSLELQVYSLLVASSGNTVTLGRRAYTLSPTLASIEFALKSSVILSTGTTTVTLSTALRRTLPSSSRMRAVIVVCPPAIGV